MIDKEEWEPEKAVPAHIIDLLVPTSPQKRINYILAFLQIIRLLKTQKRTGWLIQKIPSEYVESVSDHMYRMSIISMIIPNNSINIEQCVMISIIHDVAESLVGDITPLDGLLKEEKHRREYKSVLFLASLIKPYNDHFSNRMVDLWLDYEEIRTPEARYVKDVDKYEMILQAWEYELQLGFKHNLDQFYAARSSIKSREIGELCDEVIRKRTSALECAKDD